MARARTGRQLSDELVFLPLGGAGEIGMNVYLYGIGPSDARQWLMVDLGITFPGPNEPGVDIILPDLRFIEEEASNLVGLVLTHAHEDHYGAVIDLWPKLNVPIYATPFTSALLRAKLAENTRGLKLPINEVPLGGRFNVGPFDLEFVTMAHSIPEPSALVLRTPLGLVLHSGDWKLDDTPVLGDPTNEAKLRELGEEGIDAFVCDSTNALREGISPSESDIARTLRGLIAAAEHRVVVTTFASNVGRILAVADAARAAGRHLVVAGRAMHRIINVAMDTGYLPKSFKFSDQKEFSYLDRSEIVLLCTGSQGEGRAALSRVAEGSHSDITLVDDDLVIFSSRPIPGNEKTIGRVQNNLAMRGCRIITDADAQVHVTGHPRREELKKMYGWCRPKLAIPMHGEPRHLHEHARLAKDCGVRDVAVVRNGEVVRLGPSAAEIIDDAPVGRFYRDGKLIFSADERTIGERRRLSFVGIIVVALALSRRGEVVADPEIILEGVPEHDEAGGLIADLALDTIDGVLRGIPKARRKDADLVSDAVRRAVRAAIAQVWGKRPICRVIVSQVD